MTDEKLNEKEIFNAAREIESPEARAEYLHRACGGDADWIERFRTLLRGFEEHASFLESPPAAIGAQHAAMAEEPIAEQLGTVIGPYTLLQQIGEGGMGVVFLAEQARPVQRTVALKIIKPGMDTRQVISRFEAERQALALMDHPNIAKVFDAGATESGRPYFVMELVKGVPITDYCDECNLTTRERLQLFVTVCHAVQHAHQKAVIHRDLKPSNILVAMQDGHPAPKIIDFGVAKSLNHQLTENTVATGFGQFIGTPLYMSPEQAELSRMGADTRSDIYSLGVLLYELLTGTTPFGKDRLHSATFDELQRILREEDPPRPSARIRTLAADALSTVVERRRTEPRRLLQAVRGELDWIVMKCLDKDRNRRYATAAELAADVSRYLHHEPITAAAPSRFYRAGKFIRRNKLPASAAAAVFLGLVAGTIGMVVGLISQSRQRAEARLNLAASLHSQGRYSESEALYREGIESASNGLAEDRQRSARTLLRLAEVVNDQGNPKEAERFFREALAAYRADFPADDPNIAHALITFALFLRAHYRFDEAETHFREAYEIRCHAVPVDHRAAGESATHLANVLITLRRYEEAEEVARKAISEHRAAMPIDFIAVALAQLELGRDLIALRRFPEAEREVLSAERVLAQTDFFHAGILAPISLYTAWDRAQPGMGYDAKAHEWMRKLVGTYIRLDELPPPKSDSRHADDSATPLTIEDR
jgi:serine/threonine protein kinase